MLFAEVLAGRVLIVGLAAQRDALDRVNGRASPGLQVVELNECPCVAATPPSRPKRATSAVPFRDIPTDGRWDIAGGRPTRSLGGSGLRALRIFLLSNPCEELRDRARQDLGDVPIGDLGTHERPEFLELSCVS